MDPITSGALHNAYQNQDAQFERAFQVLRTAIEAQAFPGAAIAVTHRGHLMALKGMGHFTYEPDSPPVTAQTVYDLASVTKAIATTTACMLLYERGVFRLEQPVAEVLPEFAQGDARRARITFRMLLAHSSGLPAYVKLFLSAINKDELLEEALETPLSADPGTRSEYSDIGFIVLGLALERLLSEPLDQFCSREIFNPISCHNIVFNPPAGWKSQIPPTVNDESFRNHVVQGEVNDENAWVMGGVAGHAGCFAPAHDLAVFAECMLRGGAPVLRPETIQLFTRREATPPGTSRALGWDTPSQPSQSGKYFTASAYGHLGYTGTSLWIDPERQLSVTLLTNRTWPDCRTETIKQVRPAFHDAVVEALS